MARYVLGEQHNVRCRHPHAVGHTGQKSVNEGLAWLTVGDDVGRRYDDDQPEQRFDGRWDHEHSRDSHHEPEHRELKNEFPVHVLSFDCPLSNSVGTELNLGTTFSVFPTHKDSVRCAYDSLSA